MKLTLPADSAVRKDIPLYSGCYSYFPAALAGVAMHSKMGNDKHNPGEPLHHARGKSMDHADCIARHSMDLADMLARRVVWTQSEQDAILTEARALTWRSLAWSQELHELFGAPLAPAARLPVKKSIMFEDDIGCAIHNPERKPDFLGRTIQPMDAFVPAALQGWELRPPCPSKGCMGKSGHPSGCTDEQARAQRMAGQPTAAEAAAAVGVWMEPGADAINQACDELVLSVTRFDSSGSAPPPAQCDQTHAQGRVSLPGHFPDQQFGPRSPGAAGYPI